MQRRTFMKNTALAAGFTATWPWSDLAGDANRPDAPLWDLHVHMAQGFSMPQILELAQQRNVRFGIVEPHQFAAQSKDAKQSSIEH